MSPRNVGLLVAVAAAIAVVGPDARGEAQKVPVCSVLSLDAKGYLRNQGRFSGSLLNPKIALWNTPIGGGDLGGPSGDTFVEVVVAGAPNHGPEGLLLRMVARAESDTLLDRTLDILGFNSAGRFHAAYWLYDTGCMPITLEASLEGKGAGKGMRKVIPFRCGE